MKDTVDKTIVHFFVNDKITDRMISDYIYVHREKIKGAEPVSFSNDCERMSFYYHGSLPYDLDGWRGMKSGVLLEEDCGRRTIFATWDDYVDEDMNYFVDKISNFLFQIFI